MTTAGTKRKIESATNPKTLPDEIIIEEAPEDCLKICSWNVAGINSALKKGFDRYISAEKADILCIQETKLSAARDYVSKMDYKYQYHSNCTTKKGYSGTAVFSKIAPISVEYKIGDPELDNEGRYIVLEFEKFYLIAAYVVNAGSNLERLELKSKHYEILQKYLSNLQESKPIIFGGDLNVAHQPIDLARPKTNTK